MGCHIHKNITGRFLSLVFVAALLSAALPARAASISFFLDQSNVLPDGNNYLSVQMTDNGQGGVTFLVQTSDLFNEGRKFGIQKFGFSFLDDSWGVISDLPEGWRARSNRRMDGFGKFDIRLQGKARHRTDELGFTVNGVTLGDFAPLMSAHVAGFEWCLLDEPRNRCSGKDCFTSAFFASSITTLPSPVPSAVPVPASAWLFGSGLLGLIGAARRKQKP